ncbi:hypothetical protein C8R45DRAFT_1177711 [Mycena sanguinolenta]|nr:hypothetical protein C8R45DRAFT_1177711 [Mycena sanguinolenta]
MSLQTRFIVPNLPKSSCRLNENYLNIGGTVTDGGELDSGGQDGERALGMMRSRLVAGIMALEFVSLFPSPLCPLLPFPGSTTNGDEQRTLTLRCSLIGDSAFCAHGKIFDQSRKGSATTTTASGASVDPTHSNTARQRHDARTHLRASTYFQPTETDLIDHDSLPYTPMPAPTSQFGWGGDDAYRRCLGMRLRPPLDLLSYELVPKFCNCRRPFSPPSFRLLLLAPYPSSRPLSSFLPSPPSPALRSLPPSLFPYPVANTDSPFLCQHFWYGPRGHRHRVHAGDGERGQREEHGGGAGATAGAVLASL